MKAMAYCWVATVNDGVKSGRRLTTGANLAAICRVARDHIGLAKCTVRAQHTLCSDTPYYAAVAARHGARYD